MKIISVNRTTDMMKAEDEFEILVETESKTYYKLKYKTKIQPTPAEIQKLWDCNEPWEPAERPNK